MIQLNGRPLWIAGGVACSLLAATLALRSADDSQPKANAAERTAAAMPTQPPPVSAPPVEIAAASPAASPFPAKHQDQPDAAEPSDEPDPYEINDVTIPQGAEDGVMHPVTSEIKTGADIEAELSERTGGAYIPDNPYAAPEDSDETAADEQPTSSDDSNSDRDNR